MRFPVLLLPLALAACVSSEKERVQLEQGATPAAEQIVSETYPALYAGQVTDCLIAKSSNEELAVIMEASIKGVTGAIREDVRAQLRRPDVQSCIRLSGIDPELSANSPYSALSR